jgi:hypothetical protein
MRLSRALALASSAALLGGIVVSPADATRSAATSTAAATAGACTMTVGSVTAGGDIGYSTITAGSPITARQSTGVHMFDPGVTMLSSTWVRRRKSPSGDLAGGEVRLNANIYDAWYGTGTNGRPVSGMNLIYKNFQGYTYTERTSYRGDGLLIATYRLRGDGVLYRFVWHPTDFPYDTVTRFDGFAAVKTMALISETPTYDTFLANTHGGALYTIRFPRAAGQQPIVTRIRTSGWATFDALVAEKCGTQSTLLTAIDKDTGTAQLYAVSHGATVINNLGQVPGRYTDPVYYLYTDSVIPPLYGA